MARQACSVALQFTSLSESNAVIDELTEEAANWGPKGIKLWTMPSSTLATEPGMVMTLLVGIASGVASAVLVDFAKALFLRLRKGLAVSQPSAAAPGATLTIGSVNVHLQQNTTEIYIEEKAREVGAELALRLRAEQSSAPNS